MRKTQSLAAVALVFVLAAAPISALELSTEALAGNILFPWTQDSSTTGAFSSTNLFWGAAVSVSDTIGDGLSYKIGYATDPILRNLVSVMITYNIGFAQFGVGPFLGTFNSAETPLKSGLTTSLRFEWPGKVFVSVRSDSSLGGGMMAVGDYIQEMTEISAGWYVHNAICSLTMLTKKFYSQETDTLQTLDKLSRYTFDVNVYRKGAPLTLIWTLGYQTLSKTWDSGTAATDSLGSVILGARADWRVSRNVRITGRLETGVYTYGMDDLVGNGPDSNAFLFDAGLGVILRLGGGISGTAPAAP
jgi:hypothetical protein